MKVEHIIRDWLVENAQFIEPGLEVVDKEHYLPDDRGTSGFIDILCKDPYNNFVIVEIKRSNPAARQTFTEVLKYAELIQQTYQARKSELRIIILSTHWDEILRAFTHICFHSSIPIKGFQLFINEETKIPENKEEIVPISSSNLSRKFMEAQMCYLFFTKEKRQKANHKLQKMMKDAEIMDYVSIDLDAGKVEEIIYPFALNLAIQKLDKKDLLKKISNLGGEGHIDMEEDEFETEDGYLDFLNDVLFLSLDFTRYSDSAESSNAENFDSIINVQNWKITAVNRYGVFKSDPRYTEFMLLKELKGHDGNSHNKFVGFTESSQKERFQEIKTECKLSLQHLPVWEEIISQILYNLEQNKEEFKMVLDIYSLPSILQSLFFTIRNGNPDYLPRILFFIFFTKTKKTAVYEGKLMWNGRSPNPKILNSSYVETMILPDNEVDSILLGLSYAVEKVEFENEAEISSNYISIENGVLSIDDTEYFSIEDYFKKNQSFLTQLVQNINGTTTFL
ncbi:endonuclease NucS domain-containing protein [Algoriphagus aquimarinus]|uniref:endonuclease NucS domain-containing protein n=1 Tax=Algoriphagus aquimarinus TaxID=237018 RepID=UPI0030D6F5D1|tara:strand:- start:2257 stop:3780 length:1524 start_codon:yes stop_codon:yes gene_type:complete